MGRTGEWFGYESEGIVPDVITLAKGLGGGLPLGAMIAIGDLAKFFEPGSHGSTFGGNPIACASALAAISVLESENLLARNKELELTLKLELSKSPLVESVRGAGLLLGIVLKLDVAKNLVVELQNAGVLANATSESLIRIAPPLVVTDKQVADFVRIFREVAATHER
jgi:acetylornithine aminotransferase